MEQIENILSTFESISLADMDSVKLMDRMDSKYVFPFRQLPMILKGMSSTYCLLSINNIRLHRYESLYYDTSDLKLFAKHQVGRLNRWKLRFRRYVDSDGLTFFEIKHKNNKGRTIKNRVKVPDVETEISGKAENFLQTITPFAANAFLPRIWVNYSRMTFVNKLCQERLTIDVNLHFEKAGSVDKLGVKFPQIVIAESKRGKASSVSEFIRLVRLNGIREGSISKYCFGIYNLFGEIKKNNFKPIVRFIHKMSQTQLSQAGT